MRIPLAWHRPTCDPGRTVAASARKASTANHKERSCADGEGDRCRKAIRERRVGNKLYGDSRGVGNPDQQRGMIEPRNLARRRPMDSSPQDSQQIEANHADGLHQQQARLGEQGSDAAKPHNHRHNRATQTHPSRRSGKRLETAKAHSARAEYHALVQNDIGRGHEAGERRIEEVLAAEKDEVEQGKRHQFPSMCFEAGGHELLCARR